MSWGKTRTHIHTKQLIDLIYLAWFLMITEWTIEHCVQGFNILLLRPGLPLRLSSSHFISIFLKPEAFKQTNRKKKQIRVRKKECIFTFLGTSQLRLFFGFYDFKDKLRTGFHKSYLHYWEKFHVSSQKKKHETPKILIQHIKKIL